MESRGALALQAAHLDSPLAPPVALWLHQERFQNAESGVSPENSSCDPKPTHIKAATKKMKVELPRNPVIPFISIFPKNTQK